MPEFVHLHNHTQYSLLDGAARIDALLDRAQAEGMKAFAITDHGSMFGVPEFFYQAKKRGIKPIIGCEFYVTPTSCHEKDTTERFHMVLLARNAVGYRNLVKLSSLSYLEGYYYKPRIDIELLRTYASGITALSSCMQGQVPQHLIKGRFDEAKKLALEFFEMFEGHFYLEMQDHGIPEECEVCKGVMELNKATGIPLVCSNDIHYVNHGDHQAQDVLICLQTGKDFNDPKRFKIHTEEIYFKTGQQMADLFSMAPEAIDNTVKIAEDIDFSLKFGYILLPHFALPPGFVDADAYLEHLSWEGAKRRYPGGFTDEIRARMRFELDIIKQMGYAGYFLIVQDFTTAARDMGVAVGPGRGSAAGSIVAYSTGITDIDPLKYQLLFERFLNPERVSMPDIDMDFDDRGRAKVIEYVVQKYGRECVSQIITFGTMAARGVVKDVGRVLGVPLKQTEEIAKLIPEGPKWTFGRALKEVDELKRLAEGDDPTIRELLRFCATLEGSPRHTGVHAAGVIIAPSDVTNYVPLYKTSRDEITTQYDKDWVEKLGLLKMDFLGLKTLTIVTDTLRMVEENTGVRLDTDTLAQEPADWNDPSDPVVKTFRMLQRGETVAVFQFESPGMREYLRKLKPTCVEDMIAMNALYRPGPLEGGMVDMFINRKHGREKVEYAHPCLEPILSETYGCMVYQEQIMQIAQVMGGYTLGGADLLRRAMGKKQQSEMDKQKATFLDGAAAQKIPAKIAGETFDLMAYFAGYGFNKSHSAAYGVLAYQTAYLKANFPAEYMAASLTSEMGTTTRVSFFIEECRRMGIDVLPPCINRSRTDFTVHDGAIRFGLGAVKGVGLGAIEGILKTRADSGSFRTLFDFCGRVDSRSVNKKCLESLVQSGAMDQLDGHRAQLAEAIDRAVSHAQAKQSAEARGQSSLFDMGGPDDASGAEALSEPPLPVVTPWTQGQKLAFEKQLIGFYVSGHPLGKHEDDTPYANVRFGDVGRFTPETLPQPVRVCGIITSMQKKIDKRGNTMAVVTLEDLSGKGECLFFSDAYEKGAVHLVPETAVMIFGKGELQGDGLKVLAREVMPIGKVRYQYAKSLQVALRTEAMTADSVRSMRELLEANRGRLPIQLDVIAHDETAVPMRVRTYPVDPTPEVLGRLRDLVGASGVKVLYE